MSWACSPGNGPRAPTDAQVDLVLLLVWTWRRPRVQEKGDGGFLCRVVVRHHLAQVSPFRAVTRLGDCSHPAGPILPPVTTVAMVRPPRHHHSSAGADHFYTMPFAATSGKLTGVVDDCRPLLHVDSLDGRIRPGRYCWQGCSAPRKGQACAGPREAALTRRWSETVGYLTLRQATIGSLLYGNVTVGYP